MQPEQPLRFGPYRYDPHTGQLWSGKHEVRLTGKAAAVLRSLVERAGQTVTKEELFTAVWPRIVVSGAALTTCIRELRRALHDKARKPRYLETVHRRGYRFIAEVASSQDVVSRRPAASGSQMITNNWQLTAHLVGREAELAQLHGYLEKALSGERQVVFVTGEPGIGKTALLDTFAAQVARDPTVLIAHGQCIKHYGANEAYMPVLAALEQLCRARGDTSLLNLLRRYAPLWVVQMPALLEPAELADLQRRVAGTTRERMLREMATFLEGLTADATLVLTLEDLHWSDTATVDLLTYLAQRKAPARLLVLGSYYPGDLLTNRHPLHALVPELRVHGQSHEVTLTGLSGPAVAHYLEKRFAGSVVPPQLGQVLHERTEGHPFFLVALTDELVRQGILRVEKGSVTWQGGPERLREHIPQNLLNFFERRRARLTAEERQLLSVASIAGVEFSAALVAEVLALEVAVVEERCEALVQRQQFLRRAGVSEWRDGTTTARYGFRHALCQQLWHEQGTPTRHQQWHRQLGERLERAYGEQAAASAAELAVHFEEGRDYARAVRYLHLAGRNAVQRNAPAEAIRHFTKGIELLKTLPASRERDQQEIALQVAFGALLSATKGVGAPGVEQAFSRARE